MMEFLYFPQDRTEYIPAVIALAVVIILCFAVVYILKKQSRKQEAKMKAFEEKVMQQLDQDKRHESRS